jgi:signal transduction histidine kinase
VSINSHRFLWRLRAPVGADEIRRIERWLATARVLLALSVIVAIWLDPTELTSRSIIPYWLMRIFLAHSVVVMFLLRWRRESTSAFRLVVHTVDIVWPAVISIYATGQRSPFFLFFVFVLLAAAYRWGLWETLGTALAAVALLWGEGLILHMGFNPMGAVISDFVPKRLFMRSMLLFVTGALLGYLAEQQKQLQAEKAVIARILGKARVDAGLSGTMQAILAELISTFGASRALVASQEANSLRVFVAMMDGTPGGNTRLGWLEPTASDRDLYLTEAPGEVFYAQSKGGTAEGRELFAVSSNGKIQKNGNSPFVEHLVSRHPCNSLASVSFDFGREWWGRVFLLDPQLTGDWVDELRFLQELVRQVAPAAYNVFLLRRLRLRAGAVERARVARELHDGAVQSLIAMEMQVDVVRRKSGASQSVADELGRVQSLLREEVLKLRELMQEMKSIEVDAHKLPAFLRDTVERFQRETGISARFVNDDEPVWMPQRVCREVARIVQEALVNVRKHSKAQHAIVRLAGNNGSWRLTIEDDGRGFDFDGRLTQTELEESRKGPAVIKERVRLIDGQLTIESTPGRGSRLEILVPEQQEAAHG